MRSIRRQLLSVVLGTFVFVAAVLGFAAPASAHDAAESSSPAQGATVATAPEQVSVTFNKNPLGIGAQFSVKDSAGAEWADGAVQIVDSTATQKLKAGAPAGAYTVAWRVVSSDSHPIEGTFGFTATAAAAGAAPPGTSSAGASPSAAIPTMGTAQPGTVASPAPAESASEPFPWSLVIFAAVAVGLLVAIGILAKRRLTAGSDIDETEQA
ncbi:copper resistance CopC family protein [Pseudarthrobacter cellobiosi]|uniref:copper resistance CopC family protein n=1 Tax=Pseudarthrobacter cellobiosi TaxID=2953654 RepID=UPI00208E26CE|nr:MULTISPECIES: copper resistance CopC family protein [unclassified Pseudarthrobacter]MCO4256100.1 copper resistance protein CopC [Pseudarthrobacter sp. HLT1-5]MCO4275451.1 copper resistance protein CopC [Pseudarthrobacter sp. HLT3-5]